MSQWFAIVRIVLGVLLLATAGLKLYGLSVTSVPPVGWFSQPWVQLAVVEWELVLGIWLLSGVYQRLCWLATILTFATFAGVSGYLAWRGVTSCGCFGVIQASPWWAFGLDIAIVTTLIVIRPQTNQQPAQQTDSSAVRADYRFAFVRLVCGACLVLGLVVLAGTLVYGSPSAALARLRGETIAVTPTHLDMGSGAVGTQLHARIELKNWSDQTVRIVGGTSDCTCLTHLDLPVSIPPGESRWVTIEMRVPRSEPGKLTRRAELFTDHGRQPTVHLLVSCQVE
jgi:hypothetical protein